MRQSKKINDKTCKFVKDGWTKYHRQVEKILQHDPRPMQSSINLVENNVVLFSNSTHSCPIASFYSFNCEEYFSEFMLWLSGNMSGNKLIPYSPLKPMKKAFTYVNSFSTCWKCMSSHRPWFNVFIYNAFVITCSHQGCQVALYFNWKNSIHTRNP